MLKEIIKELENLRGKKVQIFGNDVVLDDQPSSDDFIIDTVDVLNNIYTMNGVEEVDELTYPLYIGYIDSEDSIILENGKELEPKYSFYRVSDIEEMLERYNISKEYFFMNSVSSGNDGIFVDENDDEYYDIEFDEDIAIEAENEEEYLCNLEDIWSMKEIVHSNTYNGNAPLNHHIDFQIYENSELGEYYMLLKCHRYGDVRSNYTEYALLKSDELYNLDEIFFYRKEIEFDMKLEDEEISVKCIINANSNDMTVNIDDIERDTYVRDSIDEVKEYIIEELL